jgi:uncharacterized metal-binding protein YceD (DUF177 family)
MAQASSHPARPEFSRVLQVNGNVPPQQDFRIEATASERAVLAKRFALLAVDALTAEGSLETMDGGQRAILRAHLTAKVTQACVVTLEPVAAEIDETFTLEYDADADPAALEEPEIPEDMDDMALFLEEPDPPDPLVDGVVDVGEAVAEHLALALDPYPRAPGVTFTGSTAADSGEESPFKALERLVKKTRS